MRTKPYATAIALFDEVELLDVAGPISVLSSAGRNWNFQPFKLDLLADRARPVATRSALSLDATASFATHTGAECLIIPGGYGARRAAEDPDFLAWLERTAHNAELVAAIGNGVWLLARAGLFEREEVAASPDLANELAELCPGLRPSSQGSLCSSGKFLSASKSALALDLSCEIVARCFGHKLASNLSAQLGIDWRGELAALDIVPGPLIVPK
jgi:transcriptional regulator GlxA family with amidase domain